MIIEYKKHKASFRYEDTSYLCFSTIKIGNIYLNSSLCSFKIENIPIDEHFELIKQIFIKWFQNKVDEQES